jgi:hypothetical protein
MDNTKNLNSEIQEMIDKLDDALESISSLPNMNDTLTISSDYDQISLSSYDYSNSGLTIPPFQPLTTAQLSPIMQSYGINSVSSPTTAINNNSIYTINSMSNGILGTITSQNAALSIKGKAEFEDDITIKGKSLSNILDGIEKRLAILHVNEQLENRWQELKELGDRYRELEADIISREQMFKTLKD